MITSFQYRPFNFLSNFYSPCRVVYDGWSYRTVEHAYQSAKSSDLDVRAQIQQAWSPAQAKKLGRQVTLPDNWDSIKLAIMYACLESKFDDQELRVKLLETYPNKLIEGNNWGDTYWGMIPSDSNSDGWEGENWLGKLLMLLRSQLSCV